MTIDKKWLRKRFSKSDAGYLYVSLLFNEIIIRSTDNLPWSVRGLITIDREGRYNVYINARLNRTRMEEAVEHELDHILKGDLESDRDIWEIEDYLSGN